MFSLEGRVIVVTGGSGHLGSAIGEAILEANGSAVLVGRRRALLEAVRARCADVARDRCHVFPCDVTSESGIADLWRFVEERYSGLHGLVNNAYSGRVGAIDAISREDFEDACRYNLSAPFLLSRALYPLLKAGAEASGGSSSIVNVASMYGRVSPYPSVYGDSGKNNPAHYGATKAGLIQLTRYLACHLEAGKIRVNSVSPGPFPDTSVDPGIPGFFDELRARVPMHRLARPREVAGPVVFLLSEAASYITGADLPVDGGWTAW